MTGQVQKASRRGTASIKQDQPERADYILERHTDLASKFLHNFYPYKKKELSWLSTYRLSRPLISHASMWHPHGEKEALCFKEATTQELFMLNVALVQFSQETRAYFVIGLRNGISSLLVVRAIFSDKIAFIFVCG